MSPLNKKISAFTISEMLVVLVISSIVVSLALTVLSLVQKQIQSINNNYSKNTEVRILEKALLHDFNRYDLYYKKKKNQLIGISIKDTVVYTLNETQVIRNLDTLAIPIVKSTLYLDGTIVSNNSVDAIELVLSKTQNTKKLFIAKTKDASFYMNKNGI